MLHIFGKYISVCVVNTSLTNVEHRSLVWKKVYIAEDRVTAIIQ